MTEQKEKAPQEIDLIELFSKMGTGISNGISNLFSFLYKIISQTFIYGFIAGKAILKFSIRYSPIIIVFGIIGHFYGDHEVQKQDEYYKTDAIVQTFTIGSASLIEYTNNLSAISRDSVAMSKALNISVNEAASIKKIEAFWLIDKNEDGIADEIDYENKFEPDTISKEIRILNRFHIQLLTFDPHYTAVIQEHLESYLNTYPRLDVITETKMNNLTSKVNRLNKELSILDSLKIYEYFDKGSKNNNQSILDLDKILLQTSSEEKQEARLLHDVTLGIQTQILNNQRQLALETAPFIFLKKFTQVNTPVNINLEYHIKERHTASFIILGFIFALLLKFRKNIIQFIKED